MTLRINSTHTHIQWKWLYLLSCYLTLMPSHSVSHVKRIDVCLSNGCLELIPTEPISGRVLHNYGCCQQFFFLRHPYRIDANSMSATAQKSWGVSADIYGCVCARARRTSIARPSDRGKREQKCSKQNAFHNTAKEVQASAMRKELVLHVFVSLYWITHNKMSDTPPTRLKCYICIYKRRTEFACRSDGWLMLVGSLFSIVCCAEQSLVCACVCYFWRCAP